MYSLFLFVLTTGIMFALKQIDIIFDDHYKYTILVSVQIIHLVVWLIRRCCFYDSKVLTIAFAISAGDPSKTYYKRIKKEFKEQMATHGLQKHFKIRELPTDIKFSDDTAAEKFIKKKGILLLVWGSTMEGNIRGVSSTRFGIRLSYLYVKFDKSRSIEIISDIDIATKRSLWEIGEQNSLPQLDIVLGNIVEISLFTLGVCLATIPNVSYLLKSVEVFEKLDEKLKKKQQGINFPNLAFVKQKTYCYLRDSYTSLQSFYWSNKKDLKKAIEYGDKAIKIDKNNFLAHQDMAVLKWLDGDKNAAKYHTNRAWQIRNGHPLPRFNRAFFNFYYKKFEDGLREYKEIEDVSVTNIVDVAQFVEDEFEKDASNLGLLFATAWLNINYVDPSRGIEKLEEFLKSAEGKEEYAFLVTEAKTILI